MKLKSKQKMRIVCSILLLLGLVAVALVRNNSNSEHSVIASFFVIITHTQAAPAENKRGWSDCDPNDIACLQDKMGEIGDAIGWDDKDVIDNWDDADKANGKVDDRRNKRGIHYGHYGYKHRGYGRYGGYGHYGYGGYGGRYGYGGYGGRYGYGHRYGGYYGGKYRKGYRY